MTAEQPPANAQPQPDFLVSSKGEMVVDASRVRMGFHEFAGMEEVFHHAEEGDRCLHCLIAREREARGLPPDAIVAHNNADIGASLEAAAGLDTWERTRGLVFAGKIPASSLGLVEAHMRAAIKEAIEDLVAEELAPSAQKLEAVRRKYGFPHHWYLDEGRPW